jgi:histidine triad (HIT) family protein
MTKDTCVFCAIIAKKIPATIVAENEKIIVIKDIAPKAPVHYLVIPKIHVESLVALDKKQVAIIKDITRMVQELATHLSGSQAFRLVFNTGADAGQSVFHLHGHFLSGKKILDL